LYAGRRKSAGQAKGDVIVTTIDAAAAWRVGKPITLAAIAVMLGAGLGGCETGSSLFGNSGDAALPVAEQAAPQVAPQTAKVAVAAVIGPSESVARSLETQVQAALARQNVSVAKAPSEKSEYTLRGYLVSAREKAGTKISHVWDVTDPSGKRVNRITGEELVAGAQGKDPWSAMTPPLIEQIANKTAGSLATWLPTQASVVPVAANSAPPAPTGPVATPAPIAGAGATAAALPAAAAPAPVAQPAVARTPTPPPAPVAAAQPSTPANPTTTASIERSGPITTMVPSVVGAPGDGSVALTSALQRELSKNGVSLTDKASAQTYRVEGKVVVGEGKDGKQPISIDWNVRDPQGKKVGTVSQKNEVAQGSLDGTWGKTADAAAAAAAQGIIKLLPSQAATRTN
jgi:hypothetical protein